MRWSFAFAFAASSVGASAAAARGVVLKPRDTAVPVNGDRLEFTQLEETFCLVIDVCFGTHGRLHALRGWWTAAPARAMHFSVDDIVQADRRSVPDAQLR